MGRNELFEIADSQQGYFTSLQAGDCGISRSNFHRFLASGEWIREMRGIYRLARYPLTDRPELVLYSLWSRDRKGNVQGVWSHDTALDIHNLSDLMPVKMHMTVPQKFRKGSIPLMLSLHYNQLTTKDIEQHQGYRVTTPLKTLIDVAQEGRISPDLIAQGIRQALARGQISRGDLHGGQAFCLIKIVDEYKI